MQLCMRICMHQLCSPSVAIHGAVPSYPHILCGTHVQAAKRAGFPEELLSQSVRQPKPAPKGKQQQQKQQPGKQAAATAAAAADGIAAADEQQQAGPGPSGQSGEGGCDGEPGVQDVVALRIVKAACVKAQLDTLVKEYESRFGKGARGRVLCNTLNLSH